MLYAPVLLTVYNRIEHFKKCVSSLSENEDAEKTPLFIAIDAPYREQDVKVNKEIIAYSKRINGFKSIEVIQRNVNIGAVQNARSAISEVFSKYSELIRSEDDNVFSPFFLKYINQGLELHRDNARIFSICGYSEPIEFGNILDSDIYLRRGFSSFGMGLWRDKLSRVDPCAKSFYRDLLMPSEAWKFSRSVGSNVYLGLLVAKRTNRIYQDMANIYHIYKNDLYCIHPKKTLVRNIGQDGSGLHSGTNDFLQNQEICDKEIVFSTEIENENPDVRKKLNEYYKSNKIVFFKYFLYYYYNFVINELAKQS